MQIKLEEIVISKRIRHDLGDLTTLAKSLDKHGQLNPITITPQRELVAGHRRLEAARLLGWETVAVNVINNLDLTQKLEIEIEENLHRKPLTHEELDGAYHRLEKITNPGFMAKLKLFFSKIFAFIFRRKKNHQ